MRIIWNSKDFAQKKYESESKIWIWLRHFLIQIFGYRKQILLSAEKKVKRRICESKFCKSPTLKSNETFCEDWKDKFIFCSPKITCGVDIIIKIPYNFYILECWRFAKFASIFCFRWKQILASDFFLIYMYMRNPKFAKQTIFRRSYKNYDTNLVVLY